MARIEKVLASGTIANVIFYQLNGKPCARSRPARVRQSAATQQAGHRFGSTKTLSKLLRQSLSRLLPHYHTMAMMYRVDRGVLPWLQMVQAAGEPVISLPGFPCTDDAPFTGWLRQQVTATLQGNTLQVTIPAIQPLTLPARCGPAALLMVVACINPRQQALLRCEEQTVELHPPPNVYTAAALSFDVVVDEGVFIVLSAALRYGQEQQGSTAVVEKRSVAPVVVLQGWYCGG